MQEVLLLRLGLSLILSPLRFIRILVDFLNLEFTRHKVPKCLEVLVQVNNVFDRVSLIW